MWSRVLVSRNRAGLVVSSAWRVDMWLSLAWFKGVTLDSIKGLEGDQKKVRGDRGARRSEQLPFSPRREAEA